MRAIGIHEIDGFKVGNAQNDLSATGVTVVLCKEGAVTGVDVRGGAPGTRETDLLDPVNLVDKAHAVMLAGGSAFGLDAASGVMAFLEERHVGFDVGVTTIPIVCGAVLFDLLVGDWSVRPDREMGYRACLNAGSCFQPNGNIGAGTGASVGKILGMDHAVKSGLGTYAVQIGDLKVGAIVAVNCLGDVIDPSTNEVLAACRLEDGSFGNTEDVMISRFNDKKNLFTGNTTIGVILTNGSFSKAEVKKLASMAQNGYARTIRPAHTMFDGDSIFAMSHGEVEADLSVAGAVSARVMERAVIKAIKEASPLAGLPSSH